MVLVSGGPLSDPWLWERPEQGGADALLWTSYMGQVGM